MTTIHRYSYLALCGIILVGCQSDSASGTNTAKAPAPGATSNASAKNGGSSVRRSVKTSTDLDASKIDLTAKETTIEDIVGQKAPEKLAGRQGPFETSTWQVKARLKSVQLMKDGDYYLVMKGEKGGQTVVEVPDPANCKGSPLEAQITEARKQIEEKYHPTKDVQKIDDAATVTGVGFLGWGKSSKAPKKGGESKVGARLMPGTGFKFGS